MILRNYFLYACCYYFICIGSTFFGGDSIGLVDIALGSFLVWIRVVNEVAGTDLLDEDAVKEAMPDAAMVIEQHKGFLAKWAASADPS
ncbi:hypothetical protein ACP70R_036960 [Stipagrostis hirtigluma subsp. patula]